MSEDKKIPRRKKKPHHSQSSSLLRATIMEYGIYDKEVDAYKTQFVQLFDFIEAWKRSSSAGENNNTINSNQDKASPPRETPNHGNNGKDTPPNQKHNGNNVNLQLDALPLKPYGRGLSLEEELDFRLQRMTTIANDLKVNVNKEKDRRSMLLSEVTECRERSVQVLNDMTLHFHRETELLQHRLVEMDSAIDELEQDKHSMKLAYEEMVQHANKTVEAMEQDLLTAESRAKMLDEEMKTVKLSYTSVEQENTVFREEAEELHNTVKDLTMKVATLENQLHASELSKTHYEALLDMSLDKLRLLEFGEITPNKNNLLRLRQKRALLASTSTSKSRNSQERSAHSGATLVPPTFFSRRSKSEESHDYRVPNQEMPTTPKPRLSSDSQSVTSYETGSEASAGALDTYRLQCDERPFTSNSASNTTSSLVRTNTFLPGMGMPSPKTASRKKKKKTFFAKAFQRKSQGNSDNNTLTTGGLCDGLPTIRDESRGSQISLTGLNDSGEHTGFVKSFDASLLSPQNEYHADTQDCLLQQGRSQSVDALDTYAFLTQDCPTQGAPEEEVDTHTKRTKKVQRTTSFAAIRKNGLTAFAKEVEKRFRKKRRSKTADGTEILSAKEEFERCQRPGSASKES